MDSFTPSSSNSPLLDSDRPCSAPRRNHEALVLKAGTLRISRVPTVRPKIGGVLVAPTHVGLCDTELQNLTAVPSDTVQIPGRVGTGIVVEATKDASIRAGTRVVFNPCALFSGARSPEFCIPGLLQEYVTMDGETLAAGAAVRLEGDFPNACGTLIEPLASVIYGNELMTHVVPHLRSVVVFGAGLHGLLTTTYLREMGAYVFLVDSRPSRLRTATKLGILKHDRTIAESENLTERLLDGNRGRYFDGAVVCTRPGESPQALRFAMSIVDEGGCVDLMSDYPEDASSRHGIPADVRAIRKANVCGRNQIGKYRVTRQAGRKVIVTGHRGASPNHILDAVQVFHSNTPSYAKLTTHVLSLNDAQSTLQHLGTSRVLDGRDCIQAVVDIGHAAPSRT
jgi:threonine dehydrogenase-like Zn-dependent dehydrogenase